MNNLLQINPVAIPQMQQPLSVAEVPSPASTLAMQAPDTGTMFDPISQAAVAYGQRQAALAEKQRETALRNALLQQEQERYDQGRADKKAALATEQKRYDAQQARLDKQDKIDEAARKRAAVLADRADKEYQRKLDKIERAKVNKGVKLAGTLAARKILAKKLKIDISNVPDETLALMPHDEWESVYKQSAPKKGKFRDRMMYDKKTGRHVLMDNNADITGVVPEGVVPVPKNTVIAPRTPNKQNIETAQKVIAEELLRDGVDPGNRPPELEGISDVMAQEALDLQSQIQINTKKPYSYVDALRRVYRGRNYQFSDKGDVGYIWDTPAKLVGTE